MAVGLVTHTNASVAARVDEIKVSYGHLRRLMDRLIEIRNGTDYQAVADAAGTTPATPAAGQTLFDNLDAAMGGMTTAYNALSKMDKNAL